MKKDPLLNTITRQYGQKVLIAAGSLVLSGALLLRRGKKYLRSHPHPLSSYEEAVKRIRKAQEKENSFVSEQGRTILFTHNKKTRWGVILLHGYTNCPQQFRKLGLRLFEKECNVFIPRMPHHGLRDLMTKDHSRLTAKKLTAFADSVVDTARGFGENVIVAGISASATMTGWIALSRKDVHHCVLISPVFGYSGFPLFLMKPLMNLCLTLPNFFRWWDTKKKNRTWDHQHVYPRYATRAVGELLRLGFGVQYLLRKSADCVPSVTMITNKNDHVIDNRAIYRVLRLWKKKYPGKVSSYEFQEDFKLDHDIIDPDHENQHTDLVYPVILRLIPIPHQ